MNLRATIAVLILAAGCAGLPPREPSPALLMEARRTRPEPVPFPAPRVDRPRLAIVVDDLGQSVPQAAAFEAIPVPLTFSILPDAAHAPEVARFLCALGREVLVHLPMEPEATEEAGYGARSGDLPPSLLTTTMSDEEIALRLAIFLERVPGAAGANNHMGSRFTRDPHRMEVVLAFLRERGLFFVDSRTTAATVARQVAARVGLPFAERDVFLDHDPRLSEIEARLAEVVRLAHHKGCALAIAHPIPETLEVLTRWARDPLRDVDVVPVSSLIAGPCQPAPPAPPLSGRSSGSGTGPPPRSGSSTQDGP